MLKVIERIKDFFKQEEFLERSIEIRLKEYKKDVDIKSIISPPSCRTYHIRGNKFILIYPARKKTALLILDIEVNKQRIPIQITIDLLKGNQNVSNVLP